MKPYLIIVEADYNDADYVHKLSYVDPEDLNVFKNILQKIIIFNNGINRRGLIWSTSYESGEEKEIDIYTKQEVLTQEEVDIFNEYVPYGEYGVHSITSIKILETSSEETLF